MNRLASSSTLLISVATAAALLAGCSGNKLEVNVLYDDSADFGTFATYRWETGPRDDSPDAAAIDRRIKTTAENALIASGLRPAAEGEEPDLLLTYYGGIEDNLLIEGVRWELAPRVVWTGAAPLEETRSYKVGTLVLEFADAESETVVWSGVVTGKAANSAQLRDRIEEVVRKALERFPPGD